MNMPGFKAEASLYEMSRFEDYVTKPVRANAQSEAFIELQQFAGSLPLVSYHITNCGQTDQFGGACFRSGVPKTCQLTACRRSPSPHGGISCEVIGTVDYPIPARRVAADVYVIALCHHTDCGSYLAASINITRCTVTITFFIPWMSLTVFIPGTRLSPIL